MYVSRNAHYAGCFIQTMLFHHWLLGFGASTVVWRSELVTIIFYFTMA
jgi:hypothetical protein